MDGLSMRFDAKKLKQEKELAQGKGEEGKNSGNSVLELIVHAFMGVYTLFQWGRNPWQIMKEKDYLTHQIREKQRGCQ